MYTNGIQKKEAEVPIYLLWNPIEGIPIQFIQIKEGRA
jgi:hypothetical protein